MHNVDVIVWSLFCVFICGVWHTKTIPTRGTWFFPVFFHYQLNFYRYYTPGYTFMSRNKQSRKYLIGRSYENDEFDWLFDLVIVTWKNNHTPLASSLSAVHQEKARA